MGIATEPPDSVGLEYYLEAYRELSTCCGIGMDIGPIPFTAVLEYFKVFGEGDFEEFLYYIRCMEEVQQDGRRKKVGNKGSSNSGKGRG